MAKRRVRPKPQPEEAEQRQLVFPNTLGCITHHGQFLETVWQPLLAKAGLPYRKYHATASPRGSCRTAPTSGGSSSRWPRVDGQTADTYGHVQPGRHESAATGLDRYLKA